MLRHIHGVTYENSISNDKIRSEAKVKELSTETRAKRLQWYGHVCQGDEDEDISCVMEMKGSGKRRRGKPRQRWSNTIRIDMRRCDLERDDTQDRSAMALADPAQNLQNGYPDRTTAG